MNNKIIVDKLPEKELNDFSTIITNTIKEICIFADKHNFDRNNMFQYLANRLTIMSEISTVENYNVSPKTNADRIRNMTDEELAEFISQVVLDCYYSIAYETEEYIENWNNKKSALQWLQKDVEE